MYRGSSGNSHRLPSRPVPLFNFSQTRNNPTTGTPTQAARVESALPETPRDSSSTRETFLSDDRVSFDEAQRATPSQNTTTTKNFSAEPGYERSLFAFAESDATHSFLDYSYSVYEESVTESYFNEPEGISNWLQMTPGVTEEIPVHNPFTRELAEIKNMLSALNELETSLNLVRKERLTATLVSPSGQGLSEGIAPWQSTSHSSSLSTPSHTSELTFVGTNEAPPPIPPKSPARRLAIAKNSQNNAPITTMEKIYSRLSLLSPQNSPKDFKQSRDNHDKGG